MNKEQQRIAIAEACGWTEVHRINSGEFGGLQGVAPDGVGKIIPSFCRDLNAMHEALMTLDNWGQGAVFDNHLFKVLIRRYGSDGVSTFAKVRAESHEMSEAFLRTIGKWVEE